MQKNTKTTWLESNKKLAWGIGIFLGIYIISLFTPFVSGYTQFPLYAVKCMGLPIEATSFAASYTYTVPGTAAYKIDISTNYYFCTEAEAQEAGFRKYDFSQN